MPTTTSNTTGNLLRQMYSPTGALLSSTNTKVDDVFYGQVFDSVKTPNYSGYFRKNGKPRTAIGLLPMNPHSNLRTQYNRANGRIVLYALRNGSFSGGAEFFLGCASSTGYFLRSPLPQLTSSELASVRNEAIYKLRDQVRGPKTDIVLSLVERTQSANLLANSALRICYAAKSLRSGRISGLLEALNIDSRQDASKFFAGYNRRSMIAKKENLGGSKDVFASLWLEYKYGWMPLLGDIYKSAEALAALPYKRASTILRGSASYKVKKVLTSNTTHTVDVCETELEYFIKYTCIVEFENNAVQDLSALGITNPLSTLYNAIPFSFVLDWALPVGRFLDTLDATIGVKFLQGSVSDLVRAQQKTRYSQKPGSTHIAECSVVESERFVGFTRVKLNSFPLPSFPSLKNPLSVSHAVTSLALLSKFLK